jgi:hypothetical protein
MYVHRSAPLSCCCIERVDAFAVASIMGMASMKVDDAGSSQADDLVGTSSIAKSGVLSLSSCCCSLSRRWPSIYRFDEEHGVEIMASMMSKR